MSKDILQCRIQKTLHTADGPQPLDISFSMEKGSLLALYGASGAGKTTILRILAGLTEMDKGHIVCGGLAWHDAQRKINRPARKRPVGIVFQDYALFPHLTVRGNLEFAVGKKEDKTRVDDLIDLMELGALSERRPHQLSGGQQQRVALARAMVRKPFLLLLDEPLSALDADMRFKLQDYILKAHRAYGLTTILVSHDLPEIFRLADKVICLEKGRLQRQGSPAEVFSQTRISGKFKVTGEVVDIVRADIVFIVSVLTGNTLVKVIATHDEVADLRPGHSVIVASKAFNPVILRMD